MQIGTRAAVVVAVLSVAVTTKAAIDRHLQAAGPLPRMALAKPLATLPQDLEGWFGRDVPVTDPRALYGDDWLNRSYGRAGRQESLSLWMVYSADGEDRGHHPEVCMRLTGMAEDPSGRRSIAAEGHPQPIQQFQFGNVAEGNRVSVFYWYYTLFPPRQDDLSALQRAYQRFQRRPSSLTIEVFTPILTEQDLEFAEQYVRAVDRAVQPYLPLGAVRGSRRLPVFVVNEGGVRAH